MLPEDRRLTTIVEAATQGDEHAWNALVEQFTPVLRRVAKGFRLAPQDADDVVQACWVALLDSLHTLREPEAVGAWLVTTARRQSLRMRQREVRELLTDTPYFADLPAGDCLETVVVEAERVTVLHEAVRRLPGRQRTLLETMIAAPDHSYAEFSQQLGMPVGSIGPTRERGLERLRQDERLTQLVAT
jgi:RNA polymerase sigma factor (sigma-70 family)